MSSAHSLAAAFVEHAPAVASLPIADVETRLARLTASAKEKWPDLEIETARWARHLAERLDSARGLDSLDDLDAPGLYLACACLAGDSKALQGFERELRSGPVGALRRLELDAPAIEEVLQRLRHHLLVSEEGPGRLARYSGRGSLAGWLRTTAVRIASDWRREKHPDSDSDESILAMSAGSTPELEAIRADHREHFQAALENALASLTARQRTLLRLSLVEQLSVDRIAPIYGASRATIARWIGDAKDGLAKETKRQLGARLKLGPSELESLMASLRGQMDLSLTRVLREADTGSKE